MSTQYFGSARKLARSLFDGEEIFLIDPFPTFVWMATTSPSVGFVPKPVVNDTKNFTGYYMLIVICPSSYFGVEFLN